MLGHLSHQAVHQPMIPYKMSMSGASKRKLDGFMKFLTDKEIYTWLSGKSGLSISTPQEDSELMAKMYPYWLGYKHRNAEKRGKNPVTEIGEEIQRDKAYFDSLPKGSKTKKTCLSYQFECLSPEKIAAFFRYRKGIMPYEFIEIDFNNRNMVLEDERDHEI